MRCCAAIVASLVLAACTGPGRQDSRPAHAGDSFERLEFVSEAGSRQYKLFVPARLPAGPAPLLIELHGCSSDADEEARWSRFNTLADGIGMLVAYPEQSEEANGSRCWNWFSPDHQSRGAGEPALIAGITREVMARFAVDPRRVYIGGISAGGAMANIMAVTYPDLFAAAMIYAGCQYRGTTCTAAVAALPPEIAGELAYQAMGELARVVPVLVLQGDRDLQVPYPNAEQIIGQWLASDDWADDGANNGSIARAPARTETGQVPGGHSFEIDTYTDASGCVLAQRWLVHGLGHAWSQGESDGSPRDQLFTDPLGPDLSSATLNFLLSHPMPVEGTGCLEIPDA